MKIQFPFDLRSSLDVKINFASKQHSWTAYINNAGTLAHIVCPEADLLVRLKFYSPIKTLSSRAMHDIIDARVNRFLVV